MDRPTERTHSSASWKRLARTGAPTARSHPRSAPAKLPPPQPGSTAHRLGRGDDAFEIGASGRLASALLLLGDDRQRSTRVVVEVALPAAAGRHAAEPPAVPG